MLRLRRSILSFVLLPMLHARPALAGEPLRVIVPFGSGAALDLLIRVIAPKLGEVLGTRVLIEHRPGAGGTIGTALVARAQPDGMTLLMTGSSHTLAARLYPNLSYHPIESFEPVTVFGHAGVVIASSAESGLPTLDALVRRAVADPDALLHASAGRGSASHMAMAVLQARTGMRMRHLELQSAGQIVLELLGGRVQAAAIPIPNAMALRHDRRIRMLAYTGAVRSPFLPEVSTVAESGWPGATFETWAGLLAPAGTPRQRVDELARASEAALADPGVRQQLARLGALPEPGGPAGMKARLAAEWSVATSLLREPKADAD